ENLKRRPRHGNKEDSNGLVVATIYHLRGNTHGDFLRFFEFNLEPKLTSERGSILATFVSENHRNTFPALPVREGVNVFISFSHFADRECYEQHAAIFTNSISGYGVEKLSTLIKGRVEVLLLAPTSRSLLR